MTSRITLTHQRPPLRHRLVTLRVVGPRYRAWSVHLEIGWPPRAWLNDRHRDAEGPWT